MHGMSFLLKIIKWPMRIFLFVKIWEKSVQLKFMQKFFNFPYRGPVNDVFDHFNFGIKNSSGLSLFLKELS